jgi:hypothetical protein
MMKKDLQFSHQSKYEILQTDAIYCLIQLHNVTTTQHCDSKCTYASLQHHYQTISLPAVCK